MLIRRTAVIALIGLVSFCFRVVSDDTPPSVVGDSAEFPIIVVTHTQGNRENPEKPPPEGLVVAMWSDGYVLFAPDPKTPQTGLRVATVDPKEIDRAIESISKSGFLSRTVTWGHPPDSDYSEIFVRTKEKGRHHTYWCGAPVDPECEKLGAGGNILFVTMWKETWAAIEGVKPKESKPASEVADADGRVRGFPIKKWEYLTMLRDKALWEH